MKVCNQCGTHFEATEFCPHCLATGAGEVRDYHVLPADQRGSVAEADKESTNESAGEGEGSGGEDGSGGVSIPDGGPLEQRSKSELSSLAASAGLPVSGTKAEIAARLQEEGHG